MKISCGALFFTQDPFGQTGIILGLEQGGWLPFKGCNEEGETFEETAIREVKEETCGLIHLSEISLDHTFATHAKIYKIGLCHIPYAFLHIFQKVRSKEKRDKYKEKYTVKFFPLLKILHDKRVHPISKQSVIHYWDQLQNTNTPMIKITQITLPNAMNIPSMKRSSSDVVANVPTLDLRKRSTSMIIQKRIDKNSPSFAQIVSDEKSFTFDNSKTKMDTKVDTKVKTPNTNDVITNVNTKVEITKDNTETKPEMKTINVALKAETIKSIKSLNTIRLINNPCRNVIVEQYFDDLWLEKIMIQSLTLA